MEAGPRARLGLSRAALALLLLLTLSGAALRLARLDFQSLWLDELASWQQSAAPDVAGVLARVRDDVHTPAHPLILHAVARCCGDSERWLRLPSALAGALGIPALYLFVRRLYGVREALLAAVLIAFGGTPIAFSQSARPYALLLLFACLSGACWLPLLRALRDGARVAPAAGVAYALAAIATAYSHYFGVLLVALQCAALLALAPRRAAPWVAAIAAAGLPWLPAVLEDAGRTRIWIGAPDLSQLPGTWRLFFRRPGGLEWASAALCAAFVAVRARDAWRARGSTSLRERLTSPTALALLWLLLPVTLTFAISKLWLPIYTRRNLLIVLPAAYALTARALCWLLPGARAQALAGAALAAAMLGGLWSGQYYTRVHNDQFREAAAVLAAHEAETPGAVVWAAGVPPEYFDHYLAQLGARIRTDRDARRDGDPIHALVAERRPPWFWLLEGPRKAPERLFTALEPHYELVRHDAFYRASARLYRRRRRAWRPSGPRLR